MNICVIVGHSGHNRFSHALAQEYVRGARAAGATVKLHELDKLNFDPILHEGYAKIQELEPDLKQVQQDILWADHIVSVYPMWWGTFPALFKGLIDRVFLPRAFFKFEKGKIFPQKLLKGKSGRAIVTMDTGFWLGRKGVAALHYLVTRLVVWDFVGVSPFRMTALGAVFQSTEEKRKRWLEKVYNLGFKLK